MFLTKCKRKCLCIIMFFQFWFSVHGAPAIVQTPNSIQQFSSNCTHTNELHTSASSYLGDNFHPTQKMSEMTIMLPEFFRFVESVMLIMSHPNLRGGGIKYPQYPVYNDNANYNTLPMPVSTFPHYFRNPIFSRPTTYQTLPTYYSNTPKTWFRQDYNYESQPTNYFSPLSGQFNNEKFYYGSSKRNQNDLEIFSRTHQNEFEPDASQKQHSDQNIASLKPAKNFNKFCVFQGVSSLPDPTECKKYLICFPTMFNNLQAYIAECPNDKLFSTVYRRCVQPYLVPECSKYKSKPSPSNREIEESEPNPFTKNKIDEQLKRPIKSIVGGDLKNDDKIGQYINGNPDKTTKSSQSRSNDVEEKEKVLKKENIPKGLSPNENETSLSFIYEEESTTIKSSNNEERNEEVEIMQMSEMSTSYDNSKNNIISTDTKDPAPSAPA